MLKKFRGKLIVENVEKLTDSIFSLRQKCMAKDRLLVSNFPISYAEYNCITLIMPEKDITVKRIAKKMDITSGGVTRIIPSLEKKGFIQRDISPNDRREIIVTLTEEGQKIAANVRKASIKIHEEIMDNFQFQKMDCVLEGIDELVEALDKWLKSRDEE